MVEKVDKNSGVRYNEESMFRKILTVLTLALVVFVVWGARSDISNAIGYLANTNLFFVLLLIPEQLFMYYCAGQIFFSYMAAKERARAQGKGSKEGKNRVDNSKITSGASSERSERVSKKSAVSVQSEGNSSEKGSEVAVGTSDVSSVVKKTENDQRSVLQKNVNSFSPWLLARISFELNFVNHAIPSGGFAGLGYLTWRLKGFGSSVGQTSFMYALRYAITILANQFQTVVAIVILIAAGKIEDGAWWVAGLATAICTGIVVALVAVVVIASSKKRINWFVRISTKFINSVVKTVTFGRKKQVLKFATVEEYFLDIYRDLMVARSNKKILIHPIVWGVIYSFLEVATYWLVGISMGHPWILPQIMVAEAIASVIGAVMLTPGGVGGYEGVMIFVMSVLGVDAGLATAVVITTRVVVLVGTIVSGYGFYQNAISKIGKKERQKIFGEAEE